jgi:3-oxoacyl-[acyl-carrier-protein] synthase-1
MQAVYIISDNIYSPLGSTTIKNFGKIKKGDFGIKLQDNKALADEPFYASIFDSERFNGDSGYTKFEQLLIASIDDALQNCDIDLKDKKTGLIVSSTKGNISLLETEVNSPVLHKRIAFTTSAKLVADHFGFVIEPLVISNACISGIMAILTGMRLIRSGKYENVVVSGADVLSKFILSGFQAFLAISPNPCKPFDINRDGITLGEGAATVILSVKQKTAMDIKVLGGSVSNDANHISAPSRTGEELSTAINKSLDEANLRAKDIDFVSAHGTATVYNDEMEAKAITLSNLQNVPTNSLKGYYGHTLGAAGLIEGIIAVQSLRENVVVATPGFEKIGVSTPINICSELLPGNYKNCLKTASGFGGCNAAVVFGK